MIMKIPHGTPAWFAMVGTAMVDAARQAALPPDLHVSLVERYTDGIEVAPGLLQGLRFDIAGGQPSFRIGAGPDERGDVTIAVTAAASRALNTMPGADPRFAALFADLQACGVLTIDGDLARLGAWFGAVHDRIVERTA
nr:hypothetical protein [uncultured Massilia sp.]